MAQQQRYRIVERIDAGGMAEVYRGVSESLQGFKKSVAIKRILPSLAKNKKFVAMFLDEARLSLHLQHANVVQVFDIGVGDDTYFIVMEHVDGCNLKTIVDAKRKANDRLPVSQSVFLMMETCKGLGYAHDAADPETGRGFGIVHRDVSPPNILISKQGEVKLTDFGLAKATSQIEVTDPGVVKGKFSYLSPEAANGREVDNRSDIFSAGIVLWELLAGRRLFYGDTDYQTVELVRQANIPSLTRENPEVDEELDRVVCKALSRDPARRFQHAGDFCEALAHFLFSRGLKVTNRDIGALVAETRGLAPSQKKFGESLIDNLIAEEIVRFTSLDQPDAEDDNEGVDAGAKPLSPDDLAGGGEAKPLVPGEFVDTRAWAEDASGRRSVPSPSPGRRPSQPPQASRVQTPAPRRTSPPPAQNPLTSTGRTQRPTASPKQLADSGGRQATQTPVARESGRMRAVEPPPRGRTTNPPAPSRTPSGRQAQPSLEDLVGPEVAEPGPDSRLSQVPGGVALKRKQTSPARAAIITFLVVIVLGGVVIFVAQSDLLR